MADLWEGVKKNLSGISTSINAKSKEVVKASKVKKELDELQTKMNEVFPILGELTYTMYRGGSFEREKLEEKCGEIAALEEQIRSKEKELKRISREAQEARGKRFCSFCEMEIPVDAKFCSHCGQNLSEVSKVEVKSIPPDDENRLG